MALFGALEGINRYQRSLLEELETINFSKHDWADVDALHALWQTANIIKKDIAVLVDRSGRVRQMMVANQATSSFYKEHFSKRNKGDAGVRFIRTQLKGTLQLSQDDRHALTQEQYDGLLVLGEGKDGLSALLALLSKGQDGLTDELEVYGPASLEEMETPSFRQTMVEEDKKRRTARFFEPVSSAEQAILVFLLNREDSEDNIVKELKALAETAGIEVVGTLFQYKRGRQNHLGEGKRLELIQMIQVKQADVVIFDTVLTPSSNRELEDACGVKVIDKTALILDIFAQRARSREGKLQVELAQLNYLLPRLTGKGVALSRLGGGVGTRGPGETQLESDRRHIRRRLDVVRRQLSEVMTDRETQRAARMSTTNKRFALVGYTNAGKSSLLNVLSRDTLYAKDQLFATLDPTTRQVHLPSGKKILMSDTVGFIRDLPPQLLDAFKATLEELKSADVLLHVVDVSQPGEMERIAVVESILEELDVANKPCIYVLNKIDLLETLPVIPIDIGRDERVYLSTTTGQGMASMWSVLEEYASNDLETHNFFIPFQADQGKVLASAHDSGLVSDLIYEEDGVYFRFTAEAEASIWQQLTPFLIGESK